jgi:hypothetical protein
MPEGEQAFIQRPGVETPGLGDKLQGCRIGVLHGI